MNNQVKIYILAAFFAVAVSALPNLIPEDEIISEAPRPAALVAASEDKTLADAKEASLKAHRVLTDATERDTKAGKKIADYKKDVHELQGKIDSKKGLIQGEEKKRTAIDLAKKKTDDTEKHETYQKAAKDVETNKFEVFKTALKAAKKAKLDVDKLKTANTLLREKTIAMKAAAKALKRAHDDVRASKGCDKIEAKCDEKSLTDWIAKAAEPAKSEDVCALDAECKAGSSDVRQGRAFMNGDYRLTDLHSHVVKEKKDPGNPYPFIMGRLEIMKGGKWFTLTRHHWWDNEYGAKMACRRMGYDDGKNLNGKGPVNNKIKGILQSAKFAARVKATTAGVYQTDKYKGVVTRIKCFEKNYEEAFKAKDYNLERMCQRIRGRTTLKQYNHDQNDVVIECRKGCCTGSPSHDHACKDMKLQQRCPKRL